MEADKTVEARRLIATLAERWPKCFATAPCRRVPLKLGIDKDIIAAGFEGDLVTALRYYTGATAYMKRLIAGAPRIDLDGNAVGTVSPEHAAGAARGVAARKRQRQKQLAIEEAERRRAAEPKKLSLTDLRAAALARKATAA